VQSVLRTIIKFEQYILVKVELGSLKKGQQQQQILKSSVSFFSNHPPYGPGVVPKNCFEFGFNLHMVSFKKEYEPAGSETSRIKFSVQVTYKLFFLQQSRGSFKSQ
jgi:hypothetical protein